jgi:hypothetical protein
LGIASEDLEDLHRLLVDFVAPTTHGHWLPFQVVEADVEKIRHMRRSSLNLVCLRRPGEAVIIDDVDDEALQRAWTRVERQLGIDSTNAPARQ